MTRLPYGTRRALWGVVAAVVALGLLPGTAAAQEATAAATPAPVIDSAPAKVGFDATATIRGHLENGTPGDEVSIQQKREGTDWRTVSSKPVDTELKVRFKRQDMRKTTTYRLAWTDVNGVETYSDTVKVRVRPRVTLSVSPKNTFLGRSVKLSGRILPKIPNRTVVLQQKVDGEWKSISRAAVGDGEFYASFEANHKGRRKVRVVFEGDAFNTPKTVKKPFTVYRKDVATWYGPGLYGNRTACGQRLTTETLGVAHRTLPCGTMVGLFYRGRTITVPVIDRGPYSHANWDLTSATARRLGFSGSGEIGVTR